MATLTVLKSSRGGEQMSPVAAGGGGDDFPNDGKTAFLVFNAGGSICNVQAEATVDPWSAEPTQATVAQDVGVAAGEDHVMGPFPTNIFGSSVAITYDQVVTVTVLPVSIA